MNAPALSVWRNLASRIRRPGVDGAISVRIHWVPHPALAGASPAVGLPDGQDEDWRFSPEADGRGVHAQRFGEFWRVHIDRIHPDHDLLGHLRRDTPRIWTAATAAAGLTLGAAVGGKSGALIGGTLGLLFGAATAGP